MNSSNPKPRRPRSPSLSTEILETRQMLTGGVGSTFAILPATISTAGGHTTVAFTLDPKLFTMGKKPFVLGIDVAPASTGTTNPMVKSVTTSTGKSLAVSHSTFDPKVTRTGVMSDSKLSSAALVTIPGHSGKSSTKTEVYKVNVTGLDHSSGNVLVGFYMPGDAAGTGTVNQADVNAVQFALNSNANDTTGKYNFDADANRDGQIDKKDVAIVKQNLGISTKVSPVISADLSPTGIADPKNRISAVPNVVVTGTATPGANIVYSAPNVPSQTVTADATTGSYSVPLTLNVGANTYSVVANDAFKQKITGTIASITYTPGAQPVADTAALQNATSASATATTSTSTSAS